MNSSEFNRATNLKFFFGTAVLSLALFLLSGTFVFQLLKEASGGGSGDAAKNACISVMRVNGFAPTVTGSKVVVTRAALNNLESLVFKSGVLIASCPTYKLDAFCAGPGCDVKGLSFTLVEKK